MKQSNLAIQITAGHSDVDTAEFKEYVLFIGTLFSYNLAPLSAGKTKKIVLELFNEKNVLRVIPDAEGKSLYTVQKSFEFDDFKSSDSGNKKIMLSKVTRDSLIFLFKKFAWDNVAVESAFNKISQSDFQSTFQFDEPTYNKAGDTKATIFVEHSLKEALISMVFLNGENQVIKKIGLFKTMPSPFIYGQLLGTSKWISNSEFQLSNKSKEFAITGSANGNTSVLYRPKNRNEDGIKEEIKFLTVERMVKL